MLLTLLALVAPAAASEDWVALMRAAWAEVRAYRAEERVLARVDGRLREEIRLDVVWRAPGETQLRWREGHDGAGRLLYHHPENFGGNARLAEGRDARRPGDILTVGPDSPSLRAVLPVPLARVQLGWVVGEVTSRFGRSLETLPAPKPDMIEGEPVWRIELPGDGRSGYAKAELAWGQASRLPVRFTTWDASGQIQERMLWTGLQVNPRVQDAKDFTLGSTTARP
ncbi:MAG: hypothetical protein RLZZ299_2721 [Pseudomonadota bacterium]|jgi:hypothetical protein